MKDIIKPTIKPEKDKDGNDLPIEFILEDKDFLLITAIQELTNQIKRLVAK